MNLRSWLSLCFGLAALSGAGVAADWPQFRGPARDGQSQETGLLKSWPKEGPKLLWQLKDIGDGYSAPAVVGGRLYLLSNRGMDNEFVQALSVEDGKVLWSTRIGKVGNPNQNPPYPKARSTPTLDGELMYAIGSDGDLVCLETASGKIRWQKSFRNDFGGKPGAWAYSESPLIDGDALVATPGGPEAALIAVHKKTGALIWRSAIPGGEPAGYSSAIVVQAGGHKQYVQFLDKGVVGVDAQTGRFLWRYDETKAIANMPMPVAHDGYVYTAKEHIGGGLVRLKPNGEGVAAEQVYLTRGLPNSVGGSLLRGDTLYGTNDKGLMAIEFTTGKVKWQTEGIGAGSVFYADGRLYLHGENGEVALADASPEAYREEGRFTPPDQPKRVSGPMERAWVYPVVANGRLYIRDLGTLWCYDVREARK